MNQQEMLSALSVLPPNGTLYDAGEGNTAYQLSDAAEADVLALTDRLKKDGFALYAANRIGASRFQTYVRDASETVAFVHVMFHAAVRVLRITYGPLAYLPAITEPVFEKKAKPSITQMHLQMSDNTLVCDSLTGRIASNNGAPGMSYLLQLADGRFIVIDGGNSDGVVTPALQNERGDWVVGEPTKTEDAKRLYDTMCSMLPAGESKPTVALWLITHAHGDHMTLATDFLEIYKDCFDLELVAFNFLRFENTDFAPIMQTWVTDFRTRVQTNFPHAKTWILHTGQKLVLPGCTMDVLCTAEDFACSGKRLFDGNEVSAVVRFVIGNTSFLALADAYPTTCIFMRDAYRDALQSDILQLSHHGFNGGVEVRGLYCLVDPKICFWACDEFRFRNDRRNIGSAREESSSHMNYWLRNTLWKRGEELGTREHYTESYQTTVDAETGEKQ